MRPKDRKAFKDAVQKVFEKHRFGGPGPLQRGWAHSGVVKDLIFLLEWDSWNVDSIGRVLYAHSRYTGPVGGPETARDVRALARRRSLSDLGMVGVHARWNERLGKWEAGHA